MTTALYFTSERRMPRNDAGFWNSCRVIAILSAVGICTNNECFLRNNGRHKGVSGRVSLAMKGLRGADGNWRADSGFNQGDVDEMHAAMFPGLPMPVLVGTTNWWDLFQHLPKRQSDGSYSRGNIINISVRLSVLPAGDPAAKYTRADHQVTLRARKKGKDGIWYIKVLDPMHPQDSNHQGDWVRADSIKKAAKAINGGVIIAELYGDDGEWTQSKLVAERKDEAIAALAGGYERELARVRARRDQYKDERDAAVESLAVCEAANTDDHALSDCWERVKDYVDGEIA